MSGSETNGAPVVRYAIRRKKDGRYYSGVCLCYTPPHVILCDEAHPARLFDSIEALVNDPEVCKLGAFEFEVVEMSDDNARVVHMDELYRRYKYESMASKMRMICASMADLSHSIESCYIAFEKLADHIKDAESKVPQKKK